MGVITGMGCPEQILQHCLHVVLPGQLHRAHFMCLHVIADFLGRAIFIVSFFIKCVSDCNVVFNLECYWDRVTKR